MIGLIQGGRDTVTHIPNLIRPHQRDDYTVLIPSLTLIRSQDLDLRQARQSPIEKLDLLSVGSDDGDILLLDAVGCECVGELVMSADRVVISDETGEEGECQWTSQLTWCTRVPSVSFCTRSPILESRAGTSSVSTNTAFALAVSTDSR